MTQPGRPEWLFGEGGALDQRNAELAAAQLAVDTTVRAFVYNDAATPKDRQKRDDAFRTALCNLRAINGGAAIHLFATDRRQ